MQLTIRAGDLAAALKLVKPAVGSSKIIPILAHVLLDARDETLTITATNIDLTLRTTIPANVSAAGRTTVAATKLDGWVGLHDSKVDITMKADAKGLALSAGRDKARLGVADPEGFPPLLAMDGEGIAVPAEALARGFELALPSVAKEDSRPVLSGVLFQFDGSRLSLCGADGHRLGFAEVTLDTPVPDPLSLIVPRANVAALASLLSGGGDVVIRTTERVSMATFEVNGTTLATRLIEGQFPDFKRIIPVEHRATAIVPSIVLMAQIRAALLADDGNRVQFTIGDDLAISAASSDLEHEGVIEGEISGEPLSFHLNGTFTLDAVKALASDQVVIGANGPTSPVLLTAPETGGKAVQVVMTMVRS